MALLEPDTVRQYEEIVKITYPFVRDSQPFQLDMLINNALSLGEWELARIACRSLFALQELNVIQKLRKLAIEGPPTGWYASTGVPTAFHLAWLAAGEYEDLCRQKVTLSMYLLDLPMQNAALEEHPALPQALLNGLHFHLLLHFVFNDDGPLAGEVKAQAVKDELRELYAKTHGLHGCEFTVFNFAPKPRPSGGELSVDAVAMLKRAFSCSPLVCNFLHRHLMPTQLTSATHIYAHSALGALVQDLIDGLIAQRRLESVCQHLILPLSELQRLPADDPDASAARATLARLAAALHRDDSASSAPSPKELDPSRPPNDQLMQDMIARRDSRPTSPALFSPPASPQPSLRTIVSAADIGNLALRVRIYEALLQLEGDSALRSFSQLEDAQLQRQFASKSTSFPAYMGTHPTAAELAAPVSMGSDLVERRQASYWSRTFHFVRTTRRHFLEYALETALRLVGEGKLSEVSALLRPFASLGPLVVVMAWQATLARSGAVTQLSALLEAFPVPDSVAQVNPAITPLVRKTSELELQLSTATWVAHRLLDVRAKNGKVFLGNDEVDPPPVDAQQLAVQVLKQLQESEEGAPRSLVFLVSRSLPDLPLLELISVLASSRPLPTATAQALSRDAELLHAFGALTEALKLLLSLSNGSSNSAPEAVAVQVDATRERIATHVNGLVSTFVVRLHVLEQLAALLLLDSARVISKQPSPEASTASLVTQPVARLLVDQVRDGLADLCDSDYVTAQLVLKPKWAALCSTDDATALAARAIKLARFIDEAQLRFSVLAACRIPAMDWPAAFVMPPASLLQVSVRACAWAPARQVAQFFRERIASAVVAEARLHEQIDGLHSVLSRTAAAEQPAHLEAVIACMTPAESLLLLVDLALTTASPIVGAALARRAQDVAEMLLNSSGKSQHADACKALLARYALLASSQSPPASLRAAVCGALSPLPSADAASADAALSSLQSHKLLLESLSKLRTTLAQLEQGLDVGDTGSLITSLVPKVSISLPGQARASRAYLAEFLTYIQRVADVSIAPTRNHFAMLHERIGAAAVRLALSSGGVVRTEGLAKAAGVLPAQLLASHLLQLRGTTVPLSLLEYVASTAPLAASVAAVLCIPPQPTHDAVLLYLNLAMLSAESATGAEAVTSWVRQKAAFYAQLYAALPPPRRRGGAGARDPADLAQVAALVSDDRELRPADGVRKLAERLAQAGQYEQAVALADSFLPGGAGDSLLMSALDNSQSLDASAAASYVGRLTDGVQMADNVQKLYFLWSLEVGLRLANTALVRVSPTAACAAPLRKLVAQLACFDDILRRNPQRWRRPGPPEWLYVHEKCCGDLPIVLSSLLEAPADFVLARRALALFGHSLPPALLASQERDVTVAALLSALQRGNEAEALLLLAEPGRDSAAIARAALDRKPSFLARAQLVHFLRMQFPPQGQSEHEALAARESSLRLLAGLPSELALLTSHLEGEPTLLMETLLMNELLTEIEALLRGPNPPPVDLLYRYARKAVAPRVGKPAPPPAGGMWVLTGNAEQDAQIRSRHTFASAPSAYLVKALLELAGDSARGAQVCLEACRPIAEMLMLPTTDGTSDGPPASLLQLLGLVQQLLLHGKLLLIRDSDLASGTAGQGAALADTLFQHVDLFRSLSVFRLPIAFSLADFADPPRARQLRSALLAEDRHAAALDVAVKCGIESHPVWTAWGLALLRVGKYADAREKFAAALRAPPAAVGVGAATTDAQALLPRVLEALECRREVRGDHLDNTAKLLRDQMLELASRHSGARSGGGGKTPTSSPGQGNRGMPRTPSAEMTPTSPSAVRSQLRAVRLEPAREAECLYYLERYGGPRDFLEFFLRHGQVEEALQYMLKQHLPASLFVNLLFSHCLCHLRFPQLLSACRSVDRTGAATREYLLALCAYLRKRQTYEILLEVQVSMGEVARAGLSCLELFYCSGDLAVKLKYLDQARTYFKEALANFAGNTGVPEPRSLLPEMPRTEEEQSGPVTEGDIAKYIKTINLQFDVTAFLQQQMQATKQPPPPRILSINLMGSVTHCTEIAEHLLVSYAFDLGIRVIQECRLPVTAIYSGAAAKMAKRRLEPKLQELLKAVKGTLPEEDWDEVLIACVRVYARELDDLKTAEKYIARMSREESRVDAFIVCGKLKSAYISAVKENLIEKIKAVREEALRRNDATVVQLCDKFLYLQAGPKPLGQ